MDINGKSLGLPTFLTMNFTLWITACLLFLAVASSSATEIAAGTSYGWEKGGSKALPTIGAPFNHNISQPWDPTVSYIISTRQKAHESRAWLSAKTLRIFPYDGFMELLKIPNLCAPG